MTASLYVRTPTNSKPTRVDTSVNTPRACSSQRLLVKLGQRRKRQAAPLLWEGPSAGSEGTDVVGEVASGAGGSGSRAAGGAKPESSCEQALLGTGEDEPDGVVALLPRDCGRDESKEVDEELGWSEEVR